MNVDEEKLQQVATEMKFKTLEKYIKHFSSSGQSRKVFEKKIKFDFEKYANQDVEIDWKNEFPKRFNPELKEGFFIQQIDFIDVLSNPKATEDDVKKIILENNLTPHLDENGAPLKVKSQSDLESMHNRRKFSGYGIDKDVWFNFQTEGFIFDDLPDIPRRSLCIPFEPGMNGAWAPNGYGKSFIFGTVFQTLRRSFAKGAPVESFERFLTEISALTNQTPEREVPTFSTNPQPTKPLIPFRQIALGIGNQLDSNASFAVLIDVQFDDAASVESYSLSLDMGWSPSQIEDNEESVNIPQWIILNESSTLGSSKFTGPTDVDRIRNLLNANRWELVAMSLFTQFHLTYVEIPKLAYNANMFGEIKQYIKEAVSDMIQFKPAEFCSWPYSAEIQAQIFHELQEEIKMSIIYIAAIEEDSDSQTSIIKNMYEWFASGEGFKEAVYHFLNASKENYKGAVKHTPLVEGPIEVKSLGDNSATEMSAILCHSPRWGDIKTGYNRSVLMDMYEDVHDYLTNKIGDTLYLTNTMVESSFESEEPPSKKDQESMSYREREAVRSALLGTSIGRGIINNQVQKSNYLFIKREMESSQNQKGSMEELLPLVEANVHLIAERMELALSKATILDFERSLNSVISSGGPWGVKARLMNWGSNHGATDSFILHQTGDENQRVSWSQLSFGQKSELIIEAVLAKEQQESRSNEYQRCLVIDEPEAGRSEHWTNELIHKLSVHGSKKENSERNSVLLLSHRGLLLSEVFHERGYHVMHYVDIDNSEEE